MTLIDCDVHPYLKRLDELAPYLDVRFRSRLRPIPSASFPSPNGGMRVDARPEGGEAAGSDPELFERQLLGEAGVDVAIQIPVVTSQVLDPEFNAALQGSVNQWMAETWLGKYNQHGRYRGSITIPTNNVQGAVREIEKWADHPYFVQIWIPHRATAPYGNPQYWPIWEAAASKGLPVAVHGSNCGQPALMTPVGYSHYYLEVHSVAEATAYVTHLTSFLCEGVFDAMPHLKVVMVEGGFSWVGPLMWRLDKIWEKLQGRVEVEHLPKRPSQYLYDHVRFTSQPVEEPDRPRDLIRLYDMIDAERLLMFATDYPHWDYDDPKRAFPRLADNVWRRISYQNAADLYGIAA